MGWVGGSCVHQSGPTNQFGQPRWVAKWANPGGWPSGPTQVGGQVGQPRPTYVTCAPHSTNAQPDLGRPVGQGTNSFFFSSSLDLQIDFGQERAKGATIILSLDNMGSQNYN